MLTFKKYKTFCVLINRWAIRTEHALTLTCKRPRIIGQIQYGAHERSAFVKLFVIKQHFHEHRLCILLLGDIISSISNDLNSKGGALLHCFAFYAFKTGKLTFLKTSNLILLNI